jgi:hypothetical protein
VDAVVNDPDPSWEIETTIPTVNPETPTLDQKGKAKVDNKKESSSSSSTTTATLYYYLYGRDALTHKCCINEGVSQS